MKTYDKLDKFSNYDREAAEQLAEARNEMVALATRLSELKDLVGVNEELKPFVWTTAEGVSMAIHSIEDSHFRNILKWIVDRSHSVPPALVAEAKRRGIEVPSRSTKELPSGFMSDAESDVEDDTDYDDIPF